MWAFTVGGMTVLPILEEYKDVAPSNSRNKWDYTVNPLFSITPYVKVSFFKPVYFKKTSGYLNYGLGYKQNVYKIEYEGYYTTTYPFSKAIESNGIKSWKDHYVTMDINFFHKASIGENHFLLNGLGISNNLLMSTSIKNKFYEEGNYFEYENSYKLMKNHNRFFDFDLNYILGVGISFKDKIILIPNINFSLFNLNTFWEKTYSSNSELDLNKSYFKEFQVGITIMH